MKIIQEDQPIIFFWNPLRELEYFSCIGIT